jgi:hypothetical protein
VLRIYIDQLHLRPRATNELRLLRARALRQQLIAPISLVHLVETIRVRPDLRSEIVEALLDLSRGELLKTELGVAPLEAEAHRGAFDRSWIAARTTARNVWEWADSDFTPMHIRLLRRFTTLSAERLFRGLGFLGDTRTILAHLGPILDEGANKANEGRPTLPSSRDVLATLPSAASLLPTLSDDELTQVFRAHATRRALQDAIWRARATGLESNDPVDVFPLTVALPYFDAVCVDRRMFARITEARRDVGIPWAAAFRTLPELLAWVGERVR